jgi:peptide/nickel transport system substrate-binding protein
MEEKGYRTVANQRINRRRLLGGAALGSAGLAAAGLIGCAPTERPAPETSAPEAKQPKRGGSLIDSRFQVLTGRTMDPHKETPTSNKMRRLWYQGLLGYRISTRTIEPEVAQKWEQPSEMEYIFTLQPGVKWHNKAPANGRALTAEDVLFSLNRLRTPEPAFVSSTLLDPLDKLEAIDSQRIRMTTKSPNAVFLATLRSEGTLLLAPEVAERAGRFATAESVVGTGPFILQTFEEGVGADSVRNPDYWKPGLPYLDAFSYKFFADLEQAYATALAGQADIAVVPGNRRDDFVARIGREPDLASEDSAGNWIMANVRTAPFDDARVLRGVRLLIDHQELRDSHGKLWRGAAVYSTAFATVLQQWDLTQEEYAQRPFWRQPKDAAVKEGLDLLSAAGYTRSNPLSFQFTGQVNTGDQAQATLLQLVQAQWRRLGQGAIETEIRQVDGAQATQARAQRNFTMATFPVAGAFDDPDAWLTAIMHSRGSRNYTGFSDPQVDTLIDRQRGIFNQQQRMAIVKEIVGLLAERSAQVNPYVFFSMDLVNSRVQGYTPDGTVPRGAQFEEVWIDA